MTASLRVVLPPIDAAAFSIRPAVDSRPLSWRKFAAGSARAGYIPPDLPLLPASPCRLAPCQLAALNALSNTAPLILLALINVLRKADRYHEGQKRRRREPFQKPLHFRYLHRLILSSSNRRVGRES
jgi:hypothetical protein